MSAYITRKESKEAVGIALLLGFFCGWFACALSAAVMAEVGL